jgi:hypothetical protein
MEMVSSYLSGASIREISRGSGLSYGTVHDALYIAGILRDRRQAVINHGRRELVRLKSTVSEEIKEINLLCV